MLAAAAWHADAEQRTRIVQQLVDHAAPHRDAHLAKYTLACLEAARSDPDAAHLFLAAAARTGPLLRPSVGSYPMEGRFDG
jgi:hypothetical protein